ncbi:MAG: outer membrane lipoprotein carrier protein LolA [Bacteroidetes bacterium]|nr:MAG: outer membrane lipoprotein carrier protein LolA [Bacteroidota bacterium]
MKHLVLGIMMAGFVVVGYSQSNSIGTSDPEAKKILDQVSAKVKSYKGIQANFTLQIEDAKGNPQGTKKGTLYAKGNKYRVILPGQEVYSDAKTVWTYDKSSNEVTITKFDPAANSMTPQKLLTNFYDKDYLYKLNGEQKIGNKLVQEIEMTPVDKTKNFYKIYLYIDKAKNTVYSGKLLDKSGNRYLYTINSLNGNAAIDDHMFVFDKSKYPGVEVVDLNE